MPIRVNPLAFSLCGVYKSSTAEELEYIYRRNYSELIKIGYTFCKDDLMLILCVFLILFSFMHAASNKSFVLAERLQKKERSLT
jgi:hypothetical protein